MDEILAENDRYKLFSIAENVYLKDKENTADKEGNLVLFRLDVMSLELIEI